MQPQGTALVNTAYFDSLIAEINSINLCADLQAVVNQVMASLQAEISGIEAQIAALAPIITLPTDLPSVITWITHFVDPQITAAANYAIQVEQMVAKISALASAIESAAARLESCTITVPTITV